MPPPMIICLCHRISDRDIHRAVGEGVRDFDLLQEETGVARNCEACHDCAREVFDQACARSPACHGPIAKPAVRWIHPA